MSAICSPSEPSVKAISIEKFKKDNAKARKEERVKNEQFVNNMKRTNSIINKMNITKRSETMNKLRETARINTIMKKEKEKAEKLQKEREKKEIKREFAQKLADSQRIMEEKKKEHKIK